MATRTIAITDPSGIHARPAARLAQAALDSGCIVTIAKGDGDPTPADSILSVMAMDIRQGDEVRLTVEGNDAEHVADALIAALTAAE